MQFAFLGLEEYRCDMASFQIRPNVASFNLKYEHLLHISLRSFVSRICLTITSGGSLCIRLRSKVSPKIGSKQMWQTP
jgi:hypothetical protein